MGGELSGGGGVVLRWPRSRDQGRGESDCSHPDRKSKTSTPRGEAREKGAISRAKLLQGWRREKYHSNNSIRRDQREGGRERGREFWAEGQRAAARKTRDTLSKVGTHGKETDRQPVTSMARWGGFLNPSAFISRIHLPKSPQRALVKGREFVCHIESAASASANVVALPWY